MGSALNGGILMLSQIARLWPITPGSWRWIFQLAAVPAVLGLLVLFALPESPLWLASRRRRGDEAEGSGRAPSASSRRRLRSPVRELFRPPLFPTVLAVAMRVFGEHIAVAQGLNIVAGWNENWRSK
jgi:MFS family permease